MDLDRLNRWLALLANIGVIAGIIFLALEIDQSNRIGSYSAENARRNQWIGVNRSFMEHSDVAAKLGKGIELTEEEKVKALMIARQLLNAWQDAESAYDYGLLSERTFGVTLDDIPATVAERPGLVPYFAYLVNTYRDEASTSRVSSRLIEILKEAGLVI